MADRFVEDDVTLDSVLVSGAAITPNNSTPLANVTRAIYVGTTGTLKIQMAGYYNSGANTYSGNTVLTLTGVPAGTMLPVRVNKVYTIGTANNLIGFY